MLTLACCPSAMAQATQAGKGDDPAPVPVIVERIVVSEAAESIRFVGVAAPSRRSTVGSPLAGRVMEWAVDAGETVRAGDVLAKLRTRALELQIAGAKAELDSRKATLAELEAGPLPAEIAAAQATQRAAQAAAEFAATNFERTDRLMKQRGASRTEFDQARRQRDQTRELLINAKNTTQLLVDGPRPERLAVAEAAVELQNQAIAELQDRLERSVIRAPFDGVVVTEFIEAGNWVVSGDPVAEVISLDPIEIQASVPERYINRVRVGGHCQVTIAAAGLDASPGRIQHVVPQAQQPARTFPVIIEVDNPPMTPDTPTGQDDAATSEETNRRERLKIAVGMLARVDLPIGDTTRQQMVSKDALRLGGRQPAVMVVDSFSDTGLGRARSVPVKVGRTSQSRIAVTPLADDIQLADRWVVVRGNESLNDGQAVRVEVPVAEIDISTNAGRPAESPSH